MQAPGSGESSANAEGAAGGWSWRLRRRDVGLLVLTLVLLTLLVVGHAWQAQVAPCGDRLKPGPQRWSAEWWRCPIEVNRHQRAEESGKPLGLLGLKFLADGQRGWAVGWEGTILATSDGGQSWQPQASDTNVVLGDVTVLEDGQRGWAVGNKGTILATRDGGLSWEAQPSGSTQNLYRVSMLADGQRGWAAGSAGTILATRDGGRSWQPQTSGTPQPLFSLSMLADGQYGWATGALGTFLTTIDGGRRWQPQKNPSVGGLLSESLLPDGQRGWAVGMGGTILATDDGGRTWRQQPSRSNATLRGVAVIPDGLRAWAVGDGGTILATSDGGRTWQPQQSGTLKALSSASMLADGQRGWVVGEDGLILATQDGGRSWQRTALHARWPTPLYVAGVVAALLTLGAALVALLARRQQITLTGLLSGKADADAPVTRADQDKLGFRPVVDALGYFLRHEQTEPPLTLAITAPWGRGKSSLMRMLQSRLQRNGLVTVWFNAWHHQKEPVLLAALLNALVSQGMPPLFSLQGWVFRTELVWRRFVRQPFLGLGPLLLWLLLALVLPVLVVAGLLYRLTASSSEGLSPIFLACANALHQLAGLVTRNAASEALFAGEWSRFARETLGALGNDPARVFPLLVTLYVFFSAFLLFSHYARAFPARPGALLASLGPKFTLSAAEEQTGFRQRFRDHFEDVTRCLRPNTLTIFIDDLDRCEPAKAAEMLEAVNYLSDAGPCFVVLGIASEIVEAQLGEAYKDLAERNRAFEQVRKAETPGARPARAATAAEPPWWRQPAAPAPVSVNGAGVQLAYARRYLDKLIQIRVPVPAMDAQGLSRLMATEEEADALRRRQLAAYRLEERLAQWMSRLTWLLRVGVIWSVLALLAWQGSLWLGGIERQHAEEARALEAQLSLAQRKVDEARQTANWMAQRASAPQPAPAAPAAWQRAVDQTEAERAQADSRAAQQLMEALRTELQAGRPQAFSDVRKKQDQLLAGLQALQGYSQAQQALQNGASAAATAQAAAASAAATGRPAWAASAPQAPTPKPRDTDPWSLDLPFAVLLLLTLAGLLLGRARVRITEQQEYKAAIDTCSPLLAQLPEFKAPREVKRFMNLTRYLAVRVNARGYARLPAGLDLVPWLRPLLEALLPAKAELLEREIVALTALHCARTAVNPAAQPDAWLAAPKAWVPATLDANLRDLVEKAADLLGLDDARRGVCDIEVVRRFLLTMSEIQFQGGKPMAKPSPA